MSNKILEIKGLSHRYAVDWAISDINMEIDTKGVVGLLGANGAGKSTTMNIVCGALYQTKGQVLLNGVDIREKPSLAKTFLGFLPQKAPLFPDLTVDEYLYHCADIRRMPASQIPEAIKRAKCKCGLSDKGKRLIKHLSGGYQQRVGVAQAIIHNPPFVVLDEPTNGLDPNQIMEVRKLVRDIAEERAVLMSTHILSEVQAICDRIEMIDHGKLVFSGSIEQFRSYSAPSTLMTVMLHAPSDDVLAQLPGVRRVERLTAKRIRLHVADTDKMVDVLIRESVAKGWQLSEIYAETESLDGVFAKLSGNC